MATTDLTPVVLIPSGKMLDDQLLRIPSPVKKNIPKGFVRHPTISGAVVNVARGNLLFANGTPCFLMLDLR